MCYKFGFTIITILLLAELSGLTQGAPSDVVVEKAPENNFRNGNFIVPEDCHQPKKMGGCFAQFYRYAYNVDNQSCEGFFYSGCSGNKNNFNSMEQCELTCLGRYVNSTIPTTKQ